jgi:hypothetical protein
MFQNVKPVFYKYLELLILPLLLLIYIVIVCLKKSNKHAKLPRLIWGADPIISNKYWSDSLKEKGYVSKTLMTGFYSSINKREDFDLFIEELTSARLPKNFAAYYAFFYAIYNFDIIHHPAHGFLLRFTNWMKHKEGTLIKWAGCKNVVLPYGSDIWMYSRINNLELRHALLLSYPMAAKFESEIQKQINYWIGYSSIFFPVLQTDGVGYWDILSYNYVVINENKWALNTNFSDQKNGVNDTVKIIHSPNHRGVKGTEFIIQAVENLKNEGLKVELILLEKLPNEKVNELMADADILAEQLIIAHGLSAVEGMAKGLAVISNFEDESRNKVFRTYSYLNECPIVSAGPENITDVLRSLVVNPALRRELGVAGRAYVEKYHSYAFGQFLFGQIYKKIWNGENIDLLNMFHPLNKDSYNNQSPLVKHPLLKNKLPQ